MMADDGYLRMQSILELRRYPDGEILLPALAEVRRVMDSEDPGIRPRDREDRPGGLVLLAPLPTVIVPDLHARTGFLETLARWVPPGLSRPVLELLAEGQIQVVCVGDGFHSESRAFRRWIRAYKEYTRGYLFHKAMDEEMRESLQLMLLVMDWKTHYPGFFHFLKGNHENVANENSQDNRGFRKFVDEGAMVTRWFLRFLGREVLDRWYEFEKFLPIMAVGNGFCAVHAEPRVYHPREEVINCYSDREVIYDFTWTDNGESREGSVAAYLREYFPDIPQARMFGGHRPVSEPFFLRAGGQYVQIHNPNRYAVAYLREPGDFEKGQGIIYLDEQE